MPDLSIKSKTEFLASLERLTTEATSISHDEMVAAFKSVPDNNVTAAEWYKLVDFAVDQIGQWQVKWLFSSAQAPDTIAQTEADAWERLRDVFSKALVEIVPGIEGELRHKKDLVIAQRLLEWKVQQDHGGRASKLASSVMSRLAITLNRFGCKGIAQRLYAKALYPPGTVGRTHR
ncbi:MAG: hypothetical protein ACHP6J_02645 [Burkholderiales bacterium]